MVGREGSLPLLEFALSELWQHQAHGKLTHEAYNTIGGIEQALANHAEATFSSLSEADQENAQRVFLQLVYPGTDQEDTRRVATASEVGEHWPLVSKLASARLVVTGQSENGEQTAEVTHEALIRHWGRLRRWMGEHRIFRTWQEHLRQDVRRWVEQQDEGFLLRGFPLEEARQQLKENSDKLTGGERAFIEASLALAEQEKAKEERRQRERARLRRRLTQVLSYALVIALGLAGLAGWQWQNANRQRNLAEQQKTFAEEQRDEADKQRSVAEEQRLLATFRSLEGQALAAIQNDEYALASLLTAQGLKMTTDNPENRKNFLSVMLALPPKLQTNIQNEYLQEVWAIEFSPDGKLLATSGEEIYLWDMETSEFAGTLPGHENGTRSLAFSPDSSMLVSGGEDKNIKLWDLSTLSLIGEPMTDGIDNPRSGGGDAIYSVAFSPDGKYIASGGQDRKVVFWDVATQTMVGAPLDSDSGAYWINDIAYSPDGKLLASTELCCDVFLWDVEKQTKIAVLEGHGNSVDAAAFSPDGKLLATSGWDESIIFWDMESREMIGEPFTQHTDGIPGLAFSPDGKTLVSGSRDKTIVFWDVETRTPIGEPLRGHEAGIQELAFHPGGEMLATIGVDGTTLLWDLSETQRLGESLDAYGHWVKDLIISPDNKTLVSGSWASGMFTVWDVETRTLINRTQSGRSHLNGIAFSPEWRGFSNN